MDQNVYDIDLIINMLISHINEINTFLVDDLTPDTEILEQGIIDSLGIVHLNKFIEESFNITLSEEDITIANFSTINNIAKMISGIF